VHVGYRLDHFNGDTPANYFSRFRKASKPLPAKDISGSTRRKIYLRNQIEIRSARITWRLRNIFSSLKHPASMKK
jgi:hypothetical protein